MPVEQFSSQGLLKARRIFLVYFDDIQIFRALRPRLTFTYKYIKVYLIISHLHTFVLMVRELADHTPTM